MTADRWFVLLFLMWLAWMLALLFVPGLNPNLSGGARAHVTFRAGGAGGGSTGPGAPAPSTDASGAPASPAGAPATPATSGVQ